MSQIHFHIDAVAIAGSNRAVGVEMKSIFIIVDIHSREADMMEEMLKTGTKKKLSSLSSGRLD